MKPREHRRPAMLLTSCCIALLPALFVALAAFAAPGLKAGGLSDFQVELPREVRQVAGRGQLSPVAHALITVAVPENFDAAREWPVMVISATSDREYNSSRWLLRAYVETARAAGWLLIAADAMEDVPVEQDDVALRYALNTAALAVLRSQWPGAAKAPLAFGGFSGGAKYAAWLAAGSASQGRNIVGMYLAGINQETVAAAARHFRVMSETYRSIPIFLQSGERDEISTPSDHRIVYEELKRQGFREVRLEYFPGPHVIDPGPLRTALDWFRELARQPGLAK